MIRSISVLLSVISLSLAACSHAEAPVAQDADPAVWVVRDDDTTIYLFGTVHVLKPGMTWFDDEVRAAFDRSDELVLEMVQPPPQEMQQLVARLAYNPSGPTITSQLSEQDRADYLAALKRENIPWEQLEHFDPWMAAITLSVAPMGRMGFDMTAGAEEVLSAAAQKRGMAISGLETVEQQLSYFDTLPQEQQVAYLNATVDEMKEMETEFSGLISAWSRGDTGEISRQMNKSLKETPEIGRVLLFDRNRRWADWVKARLDRPGAIFVAVGAGHLAGKGSVQDMLGKMGVRAKRLKPEEVGAR